MATVHERIGRQLRATHIVIGRAKRLCADSPHGPCVREMLEKIARRPISFDPCSDEMPRDSHPDQSDLDAAMLALMALYVCASQQIPTKSLPDFLSGTPFPPGTIGMKRGFLHLQSHYTPDRANESWDVMLPAITYAGLGKSAASNA